MIYYFTPFIQGNLGKAYNFYCNLVRGDDDWITFIDGDVMQLNMNWGSIWQDILNENNDAGIVTCKSNRASKGNYDQVCFEMYDQTSILEHRKYAKKLFEDKKLQVKKMKGQFLSGFFFSFKKKTWASVGGFEEGILDVDSKFFKKVKDKKSCLVAQGFYVLHYYRMLEGYLFKNHLNQHYI